MRPFRIVLILLCLLCTCAAFGQGVPVTPTATRAGSVAHALQQPDGTLVNIDATRAYKICSRQSPAYIAIEDPGDSPQQLVVLGCLKYPEAWQGMTCHVTGIMGTSYGMRVVTNATVTAYTDANGSIHRGGIDKPLDAPLVWITGETSIMATECPTYPVATPSIARPESPHYYLNIADLKAAPDKEVVWVSNKKIEATGSDTYGTWYRIAGDGSNDTIRVYTTTSATTLDRAYMVIGVITTLAGERVIDLDAGPNLSEVVPSHVCGPVFATYDAGRISSAKAQPDGITLNLPQKIVSAAFSGFFYITELDRCSGIRVNSRTRVTIGKIINISGATITTIDGEKCITNAVVQVASNPVQQIKPLGMTNRTIGGSGWAWENDGSSRGQIGVEAGVGLSNIGLLVRLWGKVTEVDTSHTPAAWYCIDDGTGLVWYDSAGAAHTGVRVSLGEPGNYLAFTGRVGDYVEGVNGVSSTVSIDGIVNRMLRQIGAFGSRAPPWWDVNKINRPFAPGVGP
ncbi:hypothetical protein LLG39_15815 [bacterium]|nr:hypothetical protein [bacterium]